MEWEGKESHFPRESELGVQGFVGHMSILQIGGSSQGCEHVGLETGRYLSWEGIQINTWKNR